MPSALRFPGECASERRKPGLFSSVVNRYVSGGFVNGMVASHLLCHSGTINRHSLNGALLS
ncbi:TPA: hypothetical protein MI672_13465 [Klebsiella pneumoniae]|nr:hypothetical protein [Klebsiella pneumoniae]